MTGKLADTVMSVRNGVQLARKYQPIVFNPSTPAQVAQRAKLKLMSQLSAVMADLIAFRRVRTMSARNMFTKVNIGKATYATDTASFPLEQLDLTGGVLYCTASASRFEGNIVIEPSVPENVTKLVYGVFYNINDTLELIADGTFDVVEGTAPVIRVADDSSNAILVVVYGIRPNNDNARAAFGNLQAPVATPNAILNVVRNLTEKDYTLTKTAAVKVAAPSAAVSPSRKK